MVLTALRGALGFLSRLPVGHSEAAWQAFTETPIAFPLAGYLIGALVALPFLAAALLPSPVVAAAYLAAIVLVTGVNHADGLADLGDAMAVHGDAGARRAAMQDTTVGVGAVLAVGTGLLTLALGALGVAGRSPFVAATIVLSSEVAAKLAMATVACLGQPSHEGFGASVAEPLDHRDLAAPVLVALPAAVLVGPVTLFGTVAALAVAILSIRWANRHLGGVSGDVFGATNELARVAALHASLIAIAVLEWGVVPWTPW